MRLSLLIPFIAAAALSVAACGSTGYSTPSSPTPAPSPSPTPTPAPSPSSGPSSQVTVDIVGQVGSQSFTPNPVALTTGGTILFKNDDNTIHHIVLDNGSADFGNVSPGQTSRGVTVNSSGSIGFHCTIHPSMVGTINGSAAASSPDPGQQY